MNYTLVGAALLALAVVAPGAVAAAPGNAPVDVPIDDRADPGNERAAAGPSGAADAGPETAAQAGNRGPPAALPGQVPDFVGDIHDLVRQHLNGPLDGILGDRVSDVTPDTDRVASNPES